MIFGTTWIFLLATGPAGAEPADIGTRLEPLVDGFLVEKLDGAERRLHPPARREVVLSTDAPWEGPASAYFTVLRDGPKIRLYYRGFCPADGDAEQVTCVAESEDGIRFERPELGLFEFRGSRKNNIVFRGPQAHNLAPFIDRRPGVPPEERWKAVGGVWEKLWAYRSSDGLRWTPIREEPIYTQGTFDSLNTVLWDEGRGEYRLYARYFGGGVRAIESATSKDFVSWSAPRHNEYGDGIPLEHFYTNAVVPCPGAPHILLSFPKRFVPDRTRLEGYKEPGVSDGVFMTSRDGVVWDRTFREAWLRPGPDPRNWTQRSNMPAWDRRGLPGGVHPLLERALRLARPPAAAAHGPPPRLRVDPRRSPRRRGDDQAAPVRGNPPRPQLRHLGGGIDPRRGPGRFPRRSRRSRRFRGRPGLCRGCLSQGNARFS